MPALTVDMTREDDRVVLVVKGELDDTTAQLLTAVDLSSLRQSNADTLVVDLSDVDFMDSSGIGSLVGLRNRVADAGMTTTIESAPVHIRHTLSVAGLSRLFGLV